MSETSENPYAVLDLPRTATPDEIKQAYFAQVRQHPPERDAATFKRIRAAYDQLRTPDKRVEADLRLLEEWPAPVRLPSSGPPDLSIQPEHALAVLKAMSELGRVVGQEDFREVPL